MLPADASRVAGAVHNPLLARLAPLHDHFSRMPAAGHHINATFARPDTDSGRRAITALLQSRNRPPIPADLQQLALDTGIIVVYQAFNRPIAHYASAPDRQSFLGGCPGYSPTRMTWIKTSCLWCLHRCEWATRDVNQERMLAITLPIGAFDEILRLAQEVRHGGDGECSEHSHLQPAEDSLQQQQGTGVPSRDLNTEDKKIRDPAAAVQPPGKQTTNRRDDPVRLQWDPDHDKLGGKMRRRAIQLGMRGPALALFHRSILCIDDITDVIVAPGRPEKFAANKSWMAHCDASVRSRGAQDPRVDAGNDPNGNNKKKCAATVNVGDDNETVSEEQHQQQQQEHQAALHRHQRILLPWEDIYVPNEAALAAHLRLDSAAKTHT